MTASDRLRSAAVLLRERAEAATCQCGGPVCTPSKWWFYRDELKARFHEYDEMKDAGGGDPVEFIATMSPPVALAITDWLDWMADRAESGNEHDAMSGLGLTQALATADAILGGAS